MGSSHPDDVDELTVPADPGPADETPEPAEWDDAWLPEWLGDEIDGAPSVEDAPEAVARPVPEAERPEPDDEHQPDTGAQAGPEPDPEPPVAPFDDLLTADRDETPTGPATAGAEP